MEAIIIKNEIERLKHENQYWKKNMENVKK